MHRIYHVPMVCHCSVFGCCIYGDQEDVLWNVTFVWYCDSLSGCGHAHLNLRVLAQCMHKANK